MAERRMTAGARRRRRRRRGEEHGQLRRGGEGVEESERGEEKREGRKRGRERFSFPLSAATLRSFRKQFQLILKPLVHEAKEAARELQKRRRKKKTRSQIFLSRLRFPAAFNLSPFSLLLFK